MRLGGLQGVLGSRLVWAVGGMSQIVMCVWKGMERRRGDVRKAR